MSKADIQAWTILAVTTGAIKTINIENIGGPAAETTLYLEGVADSIIKQWPETGNQQRNTRKIHEHCMNLQEDLDSAVDIFTACCLGILAQNLLVNLRDRVNNRFKIGLIDELLESINGAIDIYDPDEKREGERREAERLCSLVLKEIGW